MLKRFLKIAGITLVVLVLLGFFALHLIDFRHSSTEIEVAYAAVAVDPVPFEMDLGGRVIHGIRAGDPDKTAIVFAHGSPGTWDNFLDLMTDPVLLTKAQLIAFDRPGFGESSSGGVERSLSRQAAVIEGIIDRFCSNKTAILVGHSYGGAVIAQAAVDFPEKIGGLVIVAGSVSPDLEQKYWFNHVAEWRLINWALPRDLVTSNREILALKEELSTLGPGLGMVEIPLVIVHGENDDLVPYENVDYIRRSFRRSPILEMTDPDWGHLIPWQHPRAIREALLELMKNRE